MTYHTSVELISQFLPPPLTHTLSNIITLSQEMLRIISIGNFKAFASFSQLPHSEYTSLPKRYIRQLSLKMHKKRNRSSICTHIVDFQHISLPFLYLYVLGNASCKYPTLFVGVPMSEKRDKFLNGVSSQQKEFKRLFFWYMYKDKPHCKLIAARALVLGAWKILV